MSADETLLHVLARRARVESDRIAFQFGGEEPTYGALWNGIQRCTNGLEAAGIRARDHVLIALPNGPDFFFAFYGIQRLGAVAVPVYPGSDARRLSTFLQLSRARLALVDATHPLKETRLDGIGLRSVSSLSAPSLSQSQSSDAPFVRPVNPEEVAFIQFTSGSTADPKGVQLTHRALLTNVRQMVSGMEITAEDVFVSWLPVYHDMGLILMTMAPVLTGARLVLLPVGLGRVLDWVRAIERHRGTFTAGPDSAYRLLLQGIRRPEAFDLTSLRVALNAAEPVRAATIRGFEAAFGLHNVMTAGYGLAEATVGVSMSAPGQPVPIDDEGHVSVGRPFPGVEIRIVDGPREVPPATVGEIAVRSPANTMGYFGNPEATAQLQWQDGFLLTGDLGMLDAEGRLFIVSRKKDLILHSGRSLYPADVEEALADIRDLGRVAAVGIDRGSIAGEQLVCFAEVRRGSLAGDDEGEALIQQIVQTVHKRFGLRPARVFLLRPKTLPYTSNGKLQRTRLRDLAMDRTSQVFHGILYPRPRI